MTCWPDALPVAHGMSDQSRPLDSGRKDVLGRTVRVSGQDAAARADAPPPPVAQGDDAMVLDGLKRSAKKIVEAAKSGGWEFDGIDPAGVGHTLRFRLPYTDDPMWEKLLSERNGKVMVQMDPGSSRPQARNMAGVTGFVMASDPDSGALWSATFFGPDGERLGSTDSLSVAERVVGLRDSMIRRGYEVEEQRVEAEAVHAEKERVRDEYVAGLDSDYRWRSVAQFAAADDPELPERGGRVDGFGRRAMRDYWVQSLTKQIARSASEHVGWPDEHGVPCPPSEAVLRAVAEALNGDDDLRDETVRAVQQVVRNFW